MQTDVVGEEIVFVQEIRSWHIFKRSIISKVLSLSRQFWLLFLQHNLHKFIIQTLELIK